MEVLQFQPGANISGPKKVDFFDIGKSQLSKVSDLDKNRGKRQVYSLKNSGLMKNSLSNVEFASPKLAADYEQIQIDMGLTLDAVDAAFVPVTESNDYYEMNKMTGKIQEFNRRPDVIEILQKNERGKTFIKNVIGADKTTGTSAVAHRVVDNFRVTGDVGPMNQDFKTLAINEAFDKIMDGDAVKKVERTEYKPIGDSDMQQQREITTYDTVVAGDEIQYRFNNDVNFQHNLEHKAMVSGINTRNADGSKSDDFIAFFESQKQRVLASRGNTDEPYGSASKLDEVALAERNKRLGIKDGGRVVSDEDAIKFLDELQLPSGDIGVEITPDNIRTAKTALGLDDKKTARKTFLDSYNEDINKPSYLRSAKDAEAGRLEALKTEEVVTDIEAVRGVSDALKKEDKEVNIVPLAPIDSMVQIPKNLSVSGKQFEKTVSSDLLSKVDSILSNYNMVITEGRDSTHKSKEQMSGYSIDMDFKSGSSNPKELLEVINEGEKDGLRLIWEVKTESEKAKLIKKEPNLEPYVQVVKHASGDHFSVYFTDRTNGKGHRLKKEAKQVANQMAKSDTNSINPQNAKTNDDLIVKHDKALLALEKSKDIDADMAKLNKKLPEGYEVVETDGIYVIKEKAAVETNWGQVIQDSTDSKTFRK